MFKKNDIVCFLGDSITAKGLWMAEVYQVLRKKYSLKCINCGVSGSTATKSLYYLHERCLNFHPSCVVIMFGVNDVRYSLYKESLMGDPATEQRKKEYLDAFAPSYEKVIEECMAAGARVILCVTVPYDDVSGGEEPIMKCQDALNGCGDFVRSLAEKYGCPLVDFPKTLYRMLGEREIISSDRVHPTEEGHHVMAQVFLKELGEIDECDFDTPFVWEDWNRERYDCEQELTLVNLIEYCVFVPDRYVKQMPSEERKKIAKERYAEFEDKNNIFARAYKEYVQKIDDYSSYVEKTVDQTIF